MPRILEAVSQFKISAKRSPNKGLYRKIRIHFRKISNYGTSSLMWGGEVGALDAKPAYHPAAHHAAFFFYTCILQGAVDFAEAAYPRKAWQGLLAGVHVLHRNPA